MNHCKQEYICNPEVECALWADSGGSIKMCIPFTLIKPQLNSIVQITSSDWYRWDGSQWRKMTTLEQEAFS